MKKQISLDLRERIVAACDAQEGTREEVAKRFKVSLGMVKKLLAQRARTGDYERDIGIAAARRSCCRSAAER